MKRLLVPIDSADVNNYLKTITGESFSAKDFRTWGGTTLAGDKLYQLGTLDGSLPPQKAISQVVQEVADHLGNTPAVCRQYYIHPKVITSYESSQLSRIFLKSTKFQQILLV